MPSKIASIVTASDVMSTRLQSVNSALYGEFGTLNYNKDEVCLLLVVTEHFRVHLFQSIEIFSHSPDSFLAALSLLPKLDVCLRDENCLVRELLRGLLRFRDTSDRPFENIQR